MGWRAEPQSRIGLVVALTAILTLLTASALLAQGGAGTKPAAAGPYENVPLGHGGDVSGGAKIANMGGDRPSRQGQGGAGNGLNIGQLTLALAFVILLIFVLQWAGRRLLAGGTVSKSSRAIRLVSRSVIAPRQQLLLVQVGRRLVLVGNGGGTMHPLCEIRDAEEIAELLGQLKHERGESMAGSVRNLLGRLGTSRQTAPADDVGIGSMTDDAGEDGSSDIAVTVMRQELTESMEKVKSLAQEFPRP